MPGLPRKAGFQSGWSAPEALGQGWETEPGDRTRNFHLTVDLRQLSAAARMPLSLATVVVSLQLPASLAGAGPAP